MKKLVICAMALAAATAAQAADLKMYTEDYAPFDFLKDGTLTGHGFDIVTEALSRADMAADIEVTKWSRAVSLAEKDADTCIFTTARTQEREDRFLWAGPMYSEAIYLIQKPGTNAEVADVEGALVKKIGTQTGDFAVALLDRLGAEDIDLAPDAGKTLKKLSAGRVDYMVAIAPAAAEAKEHYGFEIAMEISRNELFLACSKTTDPVKVAKIDMAIDSIVEDGTQAALIEKYD